MTPLQDEEERQRIEAAKKSKENGLSFKDAMKAGKTKAGQKLIKDNEAKVKGKGKGLGGLKDKGMSDTMSKGSDFFKALGATTKYQGPVDTGTPVQQNDKAKGKGMTSETEYDKNSAMVDPEDEDYRKKKNQYGLE